MNVLTATAWELASMHERVLMQAGGHWCPLSGWHEPDGQFGWFCFKLFTLIQQDEAHIYYSLSLGESTLTVYSGASPALRAFRSVDGRCLAGGKPSSLWGMERKLVFPLQEHTGAESLCKGDAEPWPWTFLWGILAKETIPGIPKEMKNKTWNNPWG